MNECGLFSQKSVSILFLAHFFIEITRSIFTLGKWKERFLSRISKVQNLLIRYFLKMWWRQKISFNHPIYLYSAPLYSTQLNLTKFYLSSHNSDLHLRNLHIIFVIFRFIISSQCHTLNALISHIHWKNTPVSTIFARV